MPSMVLNISIAGTLVWCLLAWLRRPQPGLGAPTPEPIGLGAVPP